MTETTETTTTTADATEALVFPTQPAVAADATFTAQWTRADDLKDRKDPAKGLRYTDGLENLRGWCAVVTVTETDADGNETSEQVVLPLETQRAVARARKAHADGHAVTFARVAHKDEFKPEPAPKAKKTVVVSLSDADRAALQAAYAVADDATKTVLAGQFPFLAEA